MLISDPLPPEALRDNVEGRDVTGVETASASLAQALLGTA